MDFGEYGKFYPDASYICQNDEVNADWNKPTEENPGSGACWGTATGNYDDGENWDGARDWAHDMPKVQEMFIAYLKWMRNVMKYDGFRYDKGDGFNNWHHHNYNKNSFVFHIFIAKVTLQQHLPQSSPEPRSSHKFLLAAPSLWLHSPYQ